MVRGSYLVSLFQSKQGAWYQRFRLKICVLSNRHTIHGSSKPKGCHLVSRPTFLCEQEFQSFRFRRVPTSHNSVLSEEARVGTRTVREEMQRVDVTLQISNPKLLFFCGKFRNLTRIDSLSTKGSHFVKSRMDLSSPDMQP